MKIALVQMEIDSKLSNWKSNPIFYREALENRAIELITAAAEEKAKLVVLPELFNCPYFPAVKEKLDHWKTFAFETKSPLIEKFRKLARERKISIALPFLERSGKDFFNSCAVINSRGKLTGIYRKAILPNGLNAWEKRWFTPGEQQPFIFRVGMFRIGIIICYERYFPELLRKATKRGVDLVIAPSAASGSSEVSWTSLAVAHAVQNRVYYAAINRVGFDLFGKRKFYGQSLAVLPTGKVMASAKHKKDINVFFEVEKEILADARRTLPLMENLPS